MPLRGGGGVPVWHVVVIGQHAPGYVEPAFGEGSVHAVAVLDSDMGDGVGGVVHGRHHGSQVSDGRSQIGGIPEAAGVAASCCPPRVAVSDPAGAQDQAADFGGHQAQALGPVQAGAQGVPLAGDSARRGRTYVAEEEGSLVGFATWIEAGGVVELEDLFVDPGWRRRGSRPRSSATSRRFCERAAWSA